MELDLLGIQVRVVGADGLTPNERRAVDGIVQTLGYRDVVHLAKENGFASPRDMAHNFSFKNTRDYFLGEGWYDRLSHYDKNAKVVEASRKTGISD